MSVLMIWIYFYDNVIRFICRTLYSYNKNQLLVITEQLEIPFIYFIDNI